MTIQQSLKELSKAGKTKPVRDKLYETIAKHVDINKYKRNNNIPRDRNTPTPTPKNFNELLDLLKIGGNNYLHDSIGAIEDPAAMKDTLLAMIGRGNNALTKKRLGYGKAGLTNSTLLTALLARKMMDKDEEEPIFLEDF